jgi:hypothetical protein
VDWPVVTDAEPSVTLTDATGAALGAVTVIAELPLWPSQVAVIVAEPALTAVTLPVPETVATAVFDEIHEIERPLSALPDASLTVAASWKVAPPESEAEFGETVTVATGTAVTVRLAAPVTPSLAAEMLAVPAATVVTRPTSETRATFVFELVHVIARFATTVPLASRTVAEAWVVWPATTEDAARATMIEPTGTSLTLTDASPETPSVLAETDVLPRRTPRTTP